MNILIPKAARIICSCGFIMGPAIGLQGGFRCHNKECENANKQFQMTEVTDEGAPVSDPEPEPEPQTAEDDGGNGGKPEDPQPDHGKPKGDGPDDSTED